MYYITISNGLLDGNHHDRMGASVWLYMWLIDKVTKIDEDGMGWVLGGKPIQIADIKHMARRSVQRYLATLRNEDYILVKYTARGFIVGVKKAKKGFGRREAPKVAHLATPEMAHHVPKVAHHDTKSGAPNKTIQNTDITDDKGIGTGAPKGLSTGSVSAEESNSTYEVLEAFKPINKHWYLLQDNSKQYEAALRMVQLHGKDEVLKRISILANTNEMAFVSSATTPIQLELKWQDIQNQLVKEIKVQSIKHERSLPTSRF